MGYHVKILRTRHGREEPLSEEEVRRLAHVAPDAHIEPCSLKGGVLDLVIRRSGSREFRLLLQNGRLWTKNPEDDEIREMLDLAGHLGARVRGDEMETFRTVADTFVHPDDQAEFGRFTSESRRRTRRRRVITMLRLIALAVAVLGAFVSLCSQGRGTLTP